MKGQAVALGLCVALGAAPAIVAVPAQAASASSIVAKMSLDQKVGQLLQPDFRKWQQAGQTAATGFQVMNPEVGSLISKYQLGGVILFADNVTSTEQTVRLTAGLQDYAPNGVPLFITIDQEGGVVTRLQTGTNMPGNMALGATRSTADTTKSYKIIGDELDAVGVNVDFAPSVDVNNNPANPVIGVRSFSSNPSLVSKLGQAAIKALQDQDIAAAAKHFPGHGNTASDSHYDCPVVTQTKSAWNKLEAVPFKGAIKAGVDFIMTAHVQYPNIDPSQLTSNKVAGKTMVAPATLSRVFLTDILRKQLKFKGLVVTDAMDMKCISDNFTPEYSTVATLKAGADISLMPVPLKSLADEPQLASVVNAVKGAIRSGDLPMADVNAKVTRIIAAKLKLGLYKSRGSLDSQIAKANATVGKPSYRKAEAKIADDAVTVVKNAGILPMKPVTGQKVLVMAPNANQTTAMTTEIASLVSQGLLPPVSTSVLQMEKKVFSAADAAAIDAADFVIAGSYVTQNDPVVNDGNINDNSGDPSKWAIEFPRQAMKYAQTKGKPFEIMSLRNPYDLANFPESQASIAVYGHRGWENGYLRQPNIPAGIRATFGVFSPSGKLPVDVPSVTSPGTILYPYGTGLTYAAVGGSGSSSD